MNQPIKTGKHPKALFVLFFTEMWERFAYYLMVGILLLYMIDTKTGGKGFDEKIGADIVGSFIALVYLTPFIGGLIADRYLGYIKSIFIGGSLMALGYLGLSLPGNTAMFISLGLIIVGNGFFKPNISTLLDNIYNREDLKPLKDNAYNIFYMGINIGAFVCNFVAAWLRNVYGWGWAFAAAGIGLIIGLIILASFVKEVKHADVKKRDAKRRHVVETNFFFCIPSGNDRGSDRMVYPHQIIRFPNDGHTSQRRIYLCMPADHRILYFTLDKSKRTGQKRDWYTPVYFRHRHCILDDL